jgi:hypothetical protein
MLFEQKVDRIMAAVDDIAAATSALTAGQSELAAFLTDLSNDVVAIQAALNNGGSPDTTALAAATASFNTTMTQLPAAQAAIDALANPTPPAPVNPPVVQA